MSVHKGTLTLYDMNKINSYLNKVEDQFRLIRPNQTTEIVTNLREQIFQIIETKSSMGLPIHLDKIIYEVDRSFQFNFQNSDRDEVLLKFDLYPTWNLIRNWGKSLLSSNDNEPSHIVTESDNVRIQFTAQTKNIQKYFKTDVSLVKISFSMILGILSFILGYEIQNAPYTVIDIVGNWELSMIFFTICIFFIGVIPVLYILLVWSKNVNHKKNQPLIGYLMSKQGTITRRMLYTPPSYMDQTKYEKEVSLFLIDELFSVEVLNS